LLGETITANEKQLCLRQANSLTADRRGHTQTVKNNKVCINQDDLSFESEKRDSKNEIEIQNCNEDYHPLQASLCELPSPLFKLRRDTWGFALRATTPQDDLTGRSRQRVRRGWIFCFPLPEKSLGKEKDLSRCAGIERRSCVISAY
jgi:hypothetical protein